MGTSSSPTLRRALGLWDLIFIGVVMIQPIAPMGVYGVIFNRAGGHVVTTILIAMVAMLFTAISYGRMARVYPSAGSAYTYVSQEIHPALGYLTGWAMVMDYVLNPLICTVICSKLTQNIVPLPYWALAIFFAAFFSGVNLVGVKASARINEVLALGMMVVVAIFFVFVARTLWGIHQFGADYFTRPFYDPRTFSLGGVFGGTSIAVLTYIGFDGISTLSEEVEDPRRNILLATVGTCLVIGILSALEVYAAQLVWSTGAFDPAKIESAFPLVAQRAGGFFLFHLLNFTILVANIGSGMGAQLAAARLLFGMGRSQALPRGFFGSVDPVRRIPRNNVLLIGAVALGGAMLISYERGAELLNFGALIAFMGVNVAALVRYFFRGQKSASNLLPPLLGFLICALLWWNLSVPAKELGAVWLAVGIAYGAWRTRGFRKELVRFDADNAEATGA